MMKIIPLVVVAALAGFFYFTRVDPHPDVVAFSEKMGIPKPPDFVGDAEKARAELEQSVQEQQDRLEQIHAGE